MDVQEEQGVTFVTLYARIVYELAKNPCMAQESLARKLDVTMRTVQRHLMALEQEGYVRVRRDRKPFTYEIVWDRAIPYFEQLHVSTFHPEMLEKVSEIEHRG